VTDTTLRELERRFRASGSVEDEAAWLRARVRAGELEQDELDLAAYLLNEAARLAVGEEAWLELTSSAKTRGNYGRSKSVGDDIEIWIQALEYWDPELSIRAAIAVGADLLPRVRGMERPGFLSPPGALEVCQRALEASEDWLVAQTEDRLQAVRDLWNQGAMPRLNPWQLAVLRVPRVVVSVLDRRDEYERESGASVARRAHELIANSISVQHDEINGADFAEEQAYQQVKGVISDELTQWVLGYSNPVRERVEARQRPAK
jgi:hypothetical protein